MYVCLAYVFEDLYFLYGFTIDFIGWVTGKATQM